MARNQHFSIVAALVAAVGLVVAFGWTGKLALGLVVAGVLLIFSWLYLFGGLPIMTAWSDMREVQRLLFAAILLCILGGTALFLVSGA